MEPRSILEKIRNNKSLNNSRTKKLLFVTAFILIFVRILSFAWCSDDAYHAYVMSANLLDGKGFTPTPGIRVNVSTCPLWTLVVTLGMVIWNNPYAIGMIFNLLFSGIASFMLFRFIYKCIFSNIFYRSRNCYAGYFITIFECAIIYYF